MSLFSRSQVDKLPLDRRVRKIPLWVVGIITLALILGTFAIGVKRHAIATALQSGHTYKAQFAKDYILLPNQTKVKVAGVPVGVVTAVHHDSAGALVSMKIFGSNGAKLGTEPSAALRIGTLLGGISYVQLTPGGGPGHPDGTIPESRTTSPVYLDSILSAVPPPAQRGAKEFVKQFQQTFAKGGVTSTDQILATAPGALVPAGTVLDALQGDDPGDLTDLVANLEQTDATVTAQQGQIEDVVGGLGTVSNTFGVEAPALQETAGTLQTDLANTRSGLSALDTTLDELDITANVARPSVQSLSQLITQSQPTLRDAAPVLAQLDPFLATTIPVLSDLVPTSTQTTTFLDQVNGQVINTILNPILPQLVDQRSLPADEVGGQTGVMTSLYQQIAYTAAGLDGVGAYTDGSGHGISVLGAVGPGSLVGTTASAAQGLFEGHDVCGSLRCPGASGSGDDNPGPTTISPKSVAPPGYQP